LDGRKGAGRFSPKYHFGFVVGQRVPGTASKTDVFFSLSATDADGSKDDGVQARTPWPLVSECPPERCTVAALCVRCVGYGDSDFHPLDRR